MIKKKQSFTEFKLIQCFGIGSAAGLIWVGAGISASALKIPDYPPFDSSCTETQIQKYLEALNDPDRTEFVSLALDNVCKEKAVPTLTKFLQGQNENNRSLAAYWLSFSRNINKKEAISVLIASLKSKSVEIRSRTAYALGKIGAKEAIPTLSEALKDKNMAVRSRAALALVQMSASSPNLVSALIEALKDQDSYVRLEAVQALGKIGKNAASVVPALVTSLQDQNEEIRNSAKEALGQFGKEARLAIPVLADRLKQGDYRVDYIYILRKIGREAVPTLVDALKANDLGIRFAAVDALGDIGKDAKDAVSALLALVSSSNEELNHKATLAIGRIGNAHEVIPILLTKFQDKNARVRSNSAYTLGCLGTVSITGLVEALRDKFELVRANAALAFWQMSRCHSNVAADPNIQQRAIPALQEALKDSSKVVRYRATLALKELNEDGKNIPLLPKIALADEDESVRIKAAINLVGSDPSLNSQIIPILISAFDNKRLSGDDLPYEIAKLGKQSVPFLVKALQNPSSRIRAGSASSLGKIGKEAQAAVSSLVMMLKDSDKTVRIEAMSALQKIGVDKRNIAPALSELLQDQDSEVRKKAGDLLREIGAGAVRKLISNLKNKNSEVRAAAAQALRLILRTTPVSQEDSQAAISALSECLKDPDSKVRYQAVVALSQIGEKAQDEIASLIKLLKDDDEDVRYQAALVLSQVARHGIPNLIAALKDNNADVRKGAAFALGSVDPPPPNVITALEDIVKDLRDNLGVRQVAASALEGLGVKQSFFTQYGLITPENAVCPPLSEGGGSANFKFNTYTQSCLFSYDDNSRDSGASTLFDYIRKLFRRR